MPNWTAVLKEIEKAKPVNPNESAFDIVRRKYLAELYRHTDRNVIAYYSAFLTKPNSATSQLGDEDKNGLMLCVHKLDKSKGLDLFLHTAGGDIGAVESIVFYLHEIFGTDIRAIVPQLAMSAGALIACACREIIMGKHSAIGPVDPQLNGVPAIGVLKEVERAYEEISKNDRYALIWDPILSRIAPSFLEQCRWSISRSKQFLATALRDGMFKDTPSDEREFLIANIVNRLTSHDGNLGHNRHIHYRECIDMGLNIGLLENPKDKILQDLVLTVHHTFMHTLSNTPSTKIIENHLGRAHVRMEVVPQPVLQLPEEVNQAMLEQIKSERQRAG